MNEHTMSSKLDNVGTFGDRPCGCKGIRTCLLCEKEIPIFQRNGLTNQQSSSSSTTSTIVYKFCSQCETKAWINDDHRTHNNLETYDDATEKLSLLSCQEEEEGEESQSINPATNYKDNLLPSPFISIKGITLIRDFIGEDDEKLIVSLIDDPATPSPWVSSQSGRRKQDYGPKVNFRKQKVKLTGFHGLPDYGHKLLFRKLSTVTQFLNNFIPVELCNLEYVPERGSSIDPHLDDDWLWGERLVTVNLISETRLTLSPTVHLTERDDNHSQDGGHEDHFSDCAVDYSRKKEIEIPLPPRSLLILYDEARYKWYHAIKREHITSRRIGITIRELTSIFLPNGQLYSSIGKEILSIASAQLSCGLPEFQPEQLKDDGDGSLKNQSEQ